MPSRVTGVGAARAAVRRLPEALRDETAEAIEASVAELHEEGPRQMDAMGIGTSPVEAKTQNGKSYSRRQMRRRYGKSVSRRALKGRVGYLTARTRHLAFYVRFVHDGTATREGRPFHEAATEIVAAHHDARIGAALRRAMRLLG